MAEANKVEYFAIKDILCYTFVALLMGLLIGFSFAKYKDIRYNMINKKFGSLNQQYIDYERANTDLYKSEGPETMNQEEKFAGMSFWSKCHDNSEATVRFDNINWNRKPQMVVTQTKLTLNVDAEAKTATFIGVDDYVTLAGDNTSYDVTVPSDTQICVLFVPSDI